MSQRLTILIFFLFVGPASACEVGLYFDSAYTVNRIPEPTEGSFETDAFFVLTPCADAAPCSTWVGAFRGVGGVTVSARRDHQPEGGDRVLLSTLTLTVNGPGEVLFHAPPGVETPVPMLPHFPSCRVRYAAGSPFHAIATVGPEAPLRGIPFSEQPNEPEPGDWGEPPWERVDPADHRGRAVISSHPVASKRYVLPDEPRFRSLAVRAIIESVEFLAFLSHGSHYEGVAKLELKTREVYWGPVREQYTIWCEGVSIPGFIEYGTSQYRYVEGEEIVVLASWGYGFLRTSPFRSYDPDGEILKGLPPERGEAKKVDFVEKSSRADAIALVELSSRFVEGVTGIYRIAHVLAQYQGDSLGEEFVIRLPSHGQRQLVETGATRFLVFLEHHPEGGMVCRRPWQVVDEGLADWLGVRHALPDYASAPH